jgi:hypothetical protein
MAEFDTAVLQPLQERLESHRVYASLRTVEDLQVFMSHHVFSVWDFMSLIKYLQNRLAPIRVPWVPGGDPAVRFFVNQLVLEEESDEVPSSGGVPRYASHFEAYCEAMTEIGADGAMPFRFLDMLAAEGLDRALESPLVPGPARDFCRTTFGLIRQDRPHEVAAALALGREQLIPSMFRRFLGSMDITPTQAPAFHHYLNRHIHLDEDFHGPLSLRMLNQLCDGDPVRLGEARDAARVALAARIRFWDGVHGAIMARRQAA